MLWTTSLSCENFRKLRFTHPILCGVELLEAKTQVRSLNSSNFRAGIPSDPTDFSLTLHSNWNYQNYRSVTITIDRGFWNLTNCISLNSSQRCIYFCKDLVTGYCLYLTEKFDSQPSTVFKLTLISKCCRYGPDVTWNSSIAQALYLAITLTWITVRNLCVWHRSLLGLLRSVIFV